MKKYSCEKILNANYCGAVVGLEVTELGGNAVITPHQLGQLFLQVPISLFCWVSDCTCRLFAVLQAQLPSSLCLCGQQELK